MLREKMETLIRINRIIQRPPTASRLILKRYDPDRRKRERCSPSLKLVFSKRTEWGYLSLKLTKSSGSLLRFWCSSGLCITGTVGLLPPLQCRILASSRASAFPNHHRPRAKIRAIVQPRRLDDSLYGFAFL